MLVVEGAAGIGKTTLVAAAIIAAVDAGMQVARASGGELEQDLPFAVVRQLFEPVLRGASASVRAEMLSDAAGLAAPLFGVEMGDDAPETIAAYVHGLYWMCSNLCERGPLLLVVDDAHWTDESSLRFLSHLARRLGDLRLMLVLATRPGQPSANLQRALSGVNYHLIQLVPLSPEGVADVVRHELGADAQTDFCAACAEVTGGNPYLLSEAVKAARAAGWQPLDTMAPDVRRLTSTTLARTVLARISRHGTSAQAVAQSVAVLGPDAEIRRIAGLSGLDLGEVARIIDELQRDSLLTGDSPIQFVHPLVRSAVYTGCPDVTRADAHKRVVGMLRAEGVGLGQVVPHALAAQSAGDAEMVHVLLAAADDAMSSGSPEVAAQCLRRALAEPAAPALCGAVYAKLGRALGFANRTAGAEAALRQALEHVPDPLRRADIALELAWLLLVTGRGYDAKSVLADALAVAPAGSPQERRLRAMSASAGTVVLDDPETWTAQVELDAVADGALTLEERLMMATAAIGGAMSGRLGAHTAGALAAVAVAGDAPPRERWLIVAFAGPALAISDRSADAISALDWAQAASQAEGDVVTYGYLAMLRSHLWYYAGNLLEAEADARQAIQLASMEDTSASSIVVWPLLTVLVERGLLDEAERLLGEHGLCDELQAAAGYAVYTQLARGRLRRAQGRIDEALADLSAVGKALTAGGYTNPGFVHWRTDVVESLIEAGRDSEARPLALEEYKLAQEFGARRAIGIGLRTLALTESGERKIELLTESADVLATATAELEQAHTNVRLGITLIANGLRNDGVTALRSGLDLATRCRADALVEQARTQLVAAGARPRRHRATGPDALTPTEHRVATLAGGGLSNPEIAQRLFVSRRTVELHLTNTFRKLGIETRAELASALTQ